MGASDSNIVAEYEFDVHSTLEGQIRLKAVKNRKRLKNEHKHPKEIPQNRNPPDPPKTQIAPKSYQKRIKKEGKGRGRKRGMGLCVPKSKRDKLSKDKRETANKRIDKHKDTTNETRPSIIHAVRFSVSEARKAGKSRLDESWKWRRSQKYLEKVRRKSRAESCRKAAIINVGLNLVGCVFLSIFSKGHLTVSSFIIACVANVILTLGVVHSVRRAGLTCKGCGQLTPYWCEGPRDTIQKKTQIKKKPWKK